jgi:UDP-N-acetyl-D-glucosamine dehydrogenase
MTLMEKILSKTAEVGVVGLGYVGLPLAVEKAKAGYKVIGFDLQKSKVDMVNAGHNYIGDVVNEDLQALVKEGKIQATTDFERIMECDTVAVCVPTPLDKFKQPDLSYVINSTKDIAKRLHKDMLIVLESTTYPGTTEEVMLPILEESGLKAGKDFYLAFSPERVDPGNIKFKTKNTPKVVGGVTKECTEHAKALYEKVLQAQVFTVTSPKEAEMTKILENSFRLINIAFINEMAIICNKMNINIWEVIQAASTKPFGFMPFYPGPGIGGHCISLDPFYLQYKARAYDFHTTMIDLAGDITDSMPEYVVERLSEILNDNKKCLNGSRILLLGVAYKNDIDDMRESPALKVIEHLEKKHAQVLIHDPFVPEFNHNNKKYYSSPLTKDLIENMDAVVITTGHTTVDYGFVADNAKILFDTKNVTKNMRANRKNLFIL